ncbi:Xylose operon regulatory protein [Botrimarina colliarenosi]|uniref:Xylose operon regulatory protein n=1 Tax=Botrimarina colliarenosi TaxID=2528001 RepID=A0A5C6A0H5_9BACT|nr:XylR family transcriptional regulator [Botrimarina colliarenosi]TWT92905.1 Xylose operon regulatory protein [Botrimarina colliarenosi]
MDRVGIHADISYEAFAVPSFWTPMRHTPQVALLIETSRGYGRDVALGVARFARLHGPWSFHLTPGDFEQSFPSSQYWKGDGVFARLVSEEIADQLLAAGLPTIALDKSEEQLKPTSPLTQFSDLRVDSVAAARLAAEHLLERRYRHYAFVGTPGKVWSDHRQQTFGEVIRQAGFEAQVFEPVSTELAGLWEREISRLTDWVASLPKPVGIMACNDEHGLHVLDACRRAGVRVPEQVAVIGVDNDSLLCELCSPTLSSVVLNGVEGGYQAAAHLDAMMRKGGNDPREIVVNALRVEARQSTDLLGVDNRQVAAALALIKRSRGRDISADSVAEHAELNRRELDAMFRDSVGRSVSAEIQRIRLEHARRLLEETDHPIPAIAEAAGYSSASYMIQVFRRELDTTPSKYRSRVRSLSIAGVERST